MPIEPPPSRYLMPTDVVPDENDLVAVGADLEPGTLLAAYRAGMFPMPMGRRRIAWFSPDPRGILPLDRLTVTRSLRRSRRRFDVRVDEQFTAVMSACSDPGRAGAWISQSFIEAYCHLHELGWAHSVETYIDDELVGGLYGIRIGRFFAGESMFHRATDASKVALVYLVDWLNDDGATLLDVQWTTPHLRSLGAIDVPRSDYLRLLDDAVSS